MPCTVKAAQGGGYNIVDPNGKVVGHSDTISKAQASCRKRNEATGQKSSYKSGESESK